MRGKDASAHSVAENAGITPAYAGKRPQVTGAPLALIGITPAYAGKRPVLPDSKNDIEDHPRLCGEKPNVRGKNRRV